MMHNYYQNISLTSLIFIAISVVSMITAQSNEQVMQKFEAVLAPLEQNDWKQVDKNAAEFLKFAKDKEHNDLVSVVSYMHIHALSGMMNEGKLSKKEAEKKAKVFEGKTLIMPGHPFRDKCFNCLFPSEQDKKKLFCTSSNEDNTSIIAFEYYEMKEAFDEKYLNEHIGKIMKIRARLKEISTEGNILPRFRLIFDRVEYYFVEDEDMDENEERSTPFIDSLHTDFKYGVSINTLGSQMKKINEYRDKDSEVVTAILSGTFMSTKRTYVVRAVAYETLADIKDGTSHLDSLVTSINKQGTYEGLSLTRAAKVIDFPHFRGIDLCSKEIEGPAQNYTISGVWVKEGRIFEISYLVTDTIGNEIFFDLEKRNFDLFLNRFEFSESVKENKQDSKYATERNKLLKNMQIGLDKVFCKKADGNKNCLWVFVDNTASYSFTSIKSQSILNLDAHDEKGFIIPYILGEKIILIFKSASDTFEHPFTIPELPE